MKGKYTKELFDKLPAEKREKIIEAAIAEFAQAGINGCNVRDIAKRIGISHGSLFHYFASKDDMIHTIIQAGYNRQREVLVGDIPEDGDFYGHLKRIILSCLEFSRAQKDLISIWLEMSLPYHERFSRHTFDMEGEAIRSIQTMIIAARERGILRDDIDTKTAAYFIDSLFANVLKSRVSKIEEMKLKEHFGDLAAEDDAVASKIIDFARTVLSPA